MSEALASPPADGTASWRRQISGGLARLIPNTLLGLLARIAVAAIFWQSGRTKVEGILSIKDSTYFLFKSEYALPLLPSEFAAHAATYAEHFFPILLVLGLFTRFAAASLLVMTLVIQIFVYPGAWPTHLSWAVLMLLLVGRGGGALSLDRLLRLP